MYHRDALPENDKLKLIFNELILNRYSIHHLNFFQAYKIFNHILQTYDYIFFIL